MGTRPLTDAELDEIEALAASDAAEGVMTDLAQVAHHEAGHYVIGQLFGQLQWKLSIVPDRESAGRVMGEGDFYWNADADWEIDRQSLVGHVCTYYAGFAAQIRSAPESSEAARLTAWTDDEKADDLLCLAGLDTDADRKRLRQRTAELVEEHWAAIKRIAQELFAHEALDVQEAEMILAVACDGATEEDLARFRLLAYESARGHW